MVPLDIQATPPFNDDLAAFYRRALELLVQRLRTDDIGGLPYRKRQALLNECLDVLLSLDQHAQEWADEHIPAAYRQGQQLALVSTGTAAGFAEASSIIAAGIGLVNREAVQLIVQDTMTDVLAATSRVREEVKRVIRQAVAEHTRQAVLVGEKAVVAGKRIARDLSRIESPIIDRSGREWRLDVYADTVAKAKIADAYREGAIDQAVNDGFDLALVSSRGSKDACAHFEGTLVSLTGATPGYPTVAELKGSKLLFHVRCKHVLLPCNPKLLPASVRDKAERQADGALEALRLAAEGKMNSHGLKKSTS